MFLLPFFCVFIFLLLHKSQLRSMNARQWPAALQATEYMDIYIYIINVCHLNSVCLSLSRSIKVYRNSSQLKARAGSLSAP